MPDQFEIKDNGSRRNFSTGAVRDVVDDKADFTKIPFDALNKMQARHTKRYMKPVHRPTPDLTVRLRDWEEVWNSRPDLQKRFGFVKSENERVQFSAFATEMINFYIPRQVLERFALHLAKGAKKYGDSNWAKGMPIDVAFASLYRHLILWMQGDTVEDHGAAVLFNAMVIIDHERRVQIGELQSELVDKFGVHGSEGENHDVQ